LAEVIILDRFYHPMRGLFVGRFQPLHKGHLHIMMEALKEVDSLIVGVGSAERSHTPDDPFTAGERIEMVLEAAKESSVQHRILPVPIRDIDRYSIWVAHVVSLVPSFSVVYTNNPLTSSLFRNAGYEVRGTALVERGQLSGENIRRMMREGGVWEELVPESVAGYMRSIDAVRRVKGERYGS
jgi:nicotinamide-nucleotide adenylyltransferase